MRSYFMPAIAIAMIMPATARSDDIPNLDVRPICRGIASQSADPLATGLQATFEQCVQAEQDVREQLKKAWPTFSAADKRHCVALATTGGESSNTEFLTCLEMARDVRGLRSEAASSGARGATTQAPSSPSPPTVQPASANTASRPASEPTNIDADSTLKELQRVKADALNARASEALTQRKLANAEADLKRAQEEAGRATKEAEQAKADAKAVREAKAEAERKLADAESARMAAEESAAKSERGLITWLPSWLRSWFGSVRSAGVSVFCESLSARRAVSGISDSAWPRTIGRVSLATTPWSVSRTAAAQAASAVSMASTRMERHKDRVDRPAPTAPDHIGRTSVTSGMKWRSKF